jgi:hypothetical protein
MSKCVTVKKRKNISSMAKYKINTFAKEERDITEHVYVRYDRIVNFEGRNKSKIRKKFRKYIHFFKIFCNMKKYKMKALIEKNQEVETLLCF